MPVSLHGEDVEPCAGRGVDALRRHPHHGAVGIGGGKTVTILGVFEDAIPLLIHDGDVIFQCQWGVHGGDEERSF